MKLTRLDLLTVLGAAAFAWAPGLPSALVLVCVVASVAGLHLLENFEKRRAALGEERARLETAVGAVDKFNARLVSIENRLQLRRD